MSPHARIDGPNTIATADGVQLFYRDWPGSRAQAQPVLFVGGWSMASSSWGYQMMALQRRGLRCVAFDRRGHGRGRSGAARAVPQPAAAARLPVVDRGEHRAFRAGRERDDQGLAGRDGPR